MLHVELCFFLRSYSYLKGNKTDAMRMTLFFFRFLFEEKTLKVYLLFFRCPDKTINVKKQNTMSVFTNVPFSIVEQIQEHNIPENSVIFYRNNQWVYTTGDVNDINNSLQTPPIESLGPFGM